MSNFGDNYFRENTNSEDEDYNSEKDEYEESYHRQRTYSDNDSDAGNSDSDNDYPREKSELELLREKNIKKRDAFLAMLMNDPEYADVVASANELKKTNSNKISKPKKDPSFQYKGQFRIPVVTRRSSRLQNIPPVFFKEDLINEIEINRKRKRSEDYDYYDLETVIYHPKISRTSSRNTVPAQIVPVEDITNDMMANIAKKGTVKIYSDEGTSCHQCRQKTKDQKTYCRSLRCVGVRGQFCGVCLENRYGEDVAVALKDPVWNCPVCRGICNCSFCRQKAGKRPTGILAPLAQQSGHKSVKDFLESLKGEGDYAHQDAIWKQNDPNCLLGYSKDLKFAHMGKNVRHEIIYSLTWEVLKNFIWKKENELESVIDLHDEPRCLLGFFPSTDTALLDDGTHCTMGPSLLKFDQLIQKMQTNLDVEEGYGKKMVGITRSLNNVNERNIDCSETLEESRNFFLKEKNEEMTKKLLHKVDINISDKQYTDKVAEITVSCMEGDTNKNVTDFSMSLSEDINKEATLI